jgi:DNA-binding transcriptional LysR family regulator
VQREGRHTGSEHGRCLSTIESALDGMNLRFVEAFFWVATLKSVSRAAEKLHLTQSAMSARIAALEDEVGALLLDRQEKQVRLTTAGARFLVYAQKFLELQKELKAEMGASQSLATTLRLGAIESVLHSWLIPWLEHLRKERPELELELTVETTPMLMDQVQRGAQDIVFAVLPAAGEGIRHQVLPSMPMSFVGSSALHRKRSYSLQELSTLELLTFQRGSQPYVALVDILRQAKLEGKRIHAISSVSAMVQLVQGGFGVATLPRAAAERLAQVQGLRLLKCDVALPPLPIHASYRKDPSASLIEAVLASAFAFTSSKKSMG